MLKLFNSLLELKVATEGNITPKTTEMDFKLDINITTYNKELEILVLQMEFNNRLKIKKDMQIMKPNSNVNYSFKMK